MYELSVTGHFAAAHSLRNFHGKCEALHGHNWKVEVTVRGNRLDKAGLIMDFAEFKALMNQTLDLLDHKHLNELPEFRELSPSSEGIASFIFAQVAGGLPQGVELHAVSTWESENSKATFFGD